MERHEHALSELVTCWYRHLRMGGPFGSTYEPVDVPPELVDTITAVEPYRARALSDARIYLGIPSLVGAGFSIRVDHVECAPHEGWSRSISPLSFRACCRTHIEGRVPQSYSGAWDRVALEDGRWKLVSLWDESTRADVTAQIAALRDVLAEIDFVPVS